MCPVRFVTYVSGRSFLPTGSSVQACRPRSGSAMMGATLHANRKWIEPPRAAFFVARHRAGVFASGDQAT